MTKINCPCCGSPDTVSYWDVKLPAPGSSVSEQVYASTLAIVKYEYPDAGVCVDCEYMWPYPPQPPFDLKKLTIDDSHPRRIVVTVEG